MLDLATLIYLEYLTTIFNYVFACYIYAFNKLPYFAAIFLYVFLNIQGLWSP